MTSFSARSALRSLAVLSLALALGACGGLPRSDGPARVEDRGTAPPAPPVAAGSGPQIAAYTPPAAPSYARPQPQRAVTVLLDKADAQRRQGDLPGAVASLERALRIAPDDPVLWHRLAAVRLDQRSYAQVTELAAKSNALSDQADLALQRANWTLIARARAALGDAGGARQAEREAARLR